MPAAHLGTRTSFSGWIRTGSIQERHTSRSKGGLQETKSKPNRSGSNFLQQTAEGVGRGPEEGGTRAADARQKSGWVAGARRLSEQARILPVCLTLGLSVMTEKTVRDQEKHRAVWRRELYQRRKRKKICLAPLRTRVVIVELRSVVMCDSQKAHQDLPRRQSSKRTSV